ncbi:MAG: tetratricopeptide repeat protein, partial [Armatimonadetes bacterium]|nr:tetratricopeptide repeat protein [Armatimonadota bacterium]
TTLPALLLAGCGGPRPDRTDPEGSPPPPTLTTPRPSLPVPRWNQRPLTAREQPGELSAAEQETLDRAYETALNRARATQGRAAIPAFQAFVDRYPFHSRANASLGLSYQAAGDLLRALPHLEAAAVLEPDSTRALLQYGTALYEADRLSEAAGVLARAAELDLRDPTPRFLLADVLGRMGFFAPSLQLLSECISLNPGERSYWMLRGWQRLQSAAGPEPADAAEADFQQALEMEPHRGDSVWGKGVCAQRRGDWGSARALLAIAVERSPELAGAWWALAQTYRRLQDPAGASHALQQFEKLHAGEVASIQRSFFENQARRNPGSADARYLLGVWYEQQGQPNLARGAYQEAIRLAGSHGPAAARLRGRSGAEASRGR